MSITENKTDAQEHHEALEKTHHSSRKMGTLTIFLIFGLFGVWSIFADIATTITSNGKIITETYNKIVIHPRGGMVKNVFVNEGDVVKKGDRLLEIDSIDFQSQLNAAIDKYDTNLFTICRLYAQAFFVKKFDCDTYDAKMLNPEQSQQIKTDTESLFYAEMNSLESRIALLNSKNNILLEQNEGLEKEIEFNKKMLISYEKELNKWKKLFRQNAVDEQKIIETARKVEQVKQQINSLESKTRENIANMDTNKRQIDLEKNSFKNKTLSDLGRLKLDNKLALAQIMSYKNGVENAMIKSPGEGRITDMKIHVAGEVVAPQKPIMSIVPKAQKMKIEAYVVPTDIEKVYIGQQSEISFPSFVDPSAIPVIGEVTYISADAIIPEGMNEFMYRILVNITPEGLEAIKTNGFTLLPGMPVSIFVKTGEMTLFEYMMHPIIQLSKGIFHAN